MFVKIIARQGSHIRLWSTPRLA